MNPILPLESYYAIQLIATFFTIVWAMLSWTWVRG